MSENYKTIVCFGARGDALNCTPFIAHYKKKGFKIRFITSNKYRHTVAHNDMIDELIAFDPILSLDNTPLKGNEYLTETHLRADEINTRYGDALYPAPYSRYLNFTIRNYGLTWNNGKPGLVVMPHYSNGKPISSILSYIKNSLPVDETWQADFMPYVCLSEDEVAEATSYIADLDPSKSNVLIEYEFKSNQSMLNEKIILDLIDSLGKTRKLNLIFSGLEKPSFFEFLEENYPKHSICFYNKSFMSNAELYNHCDYFISSCSGIHCLTSSDYCKDSNTKRFEFCKGEHWASNLWTHNKDKKYIIYSQDQYVQLIKDLEDLNE